MDQFLYSYNESRLNDLWNANGNKRYSIKKFLNNDGKCVTHIIFKDKYCDRDVVGKVITLFSEGEVFHWPRLHHRSLAPLLDIVSIHDNLSIFISIYKENSLRKIVHDKDFINSPCCFNNKKIYIEDILWGLDYLHRNSLVLMNLSDANIYICTESNKAIITDFSCLNSICKAKKLGFMVPSLYKAPELKEQNDFLERCQIFSPVAAEMWAVGVMILEVFVQHRVPWALVNYDSNRVGEIIDYIDYDDFKMANKGSVLSEEDLISFKEFVKLFLTCSPHCRYDARYAALSLFLQSSENKIPKIMEKCCYYNKRKQEKKFKADNSSGCILTHRSSIRLNVQQFAAEDKFPEIFYEKRDSKQCNDASQVASTEFKIPFQGVRKTSSTVRPNSEINFTKQNNDENSFTEVPECKSGGKTATFSKSLNTIREKSLYSELQEALKKEMGFSEDIEKNENFANELEEQVQNFRNDIHNLNNVDLKSNQTKQYHNKLGRNINNSESNLLSEKQVYCFKSKSMSFVGIKSSTSIHDFQSSNSNKIATGINDTTLSNNKVAEFENDQSELNYVKKDSSLFIRKSTTRKSSKSSSHKDENQQEANQYKFNEESTITKTIFVKEQNKPFEFTGTWKKLPQPISNEYSRCIFRNRSHCPVHHKIECLDNYQHKESDEFKYFKIDDRDFNSSSHYNESKQNIKQSENSSVRYNTVPLSSCYYTQITENFHDLKNASPKFKDNNKNFFSQRTQSYKGAMCSNDFPPNEKHIPNLQPIKKFEAGKLQSVEKVKPKKFRKPCLLKIEVVSQNCCHTHKDKRTIVDTGIKRVKNNCKGSKVKGRQKNNAEIKPTSQDSFPRKMITAEQTMVSRSFTILETDSIHNDNTSVQNNGTKKKKSMKKITRHFFCLGRE
ncbi:protein kinase domain-containing protein [Caerostris darwini]|uniref:Protein kinase domain-containing protein n=1 Tax=Caerostris darwini TaxID=1538125 RepID=A0AAV4RZT9_9ARAC|nr:protein kinase domain-containing protein [Caerostris darwini]